MDGPLDLRLFEKQDEYAQAVLSGRFNYLLYGGAIRGGKSIVVLVLLILFARLFKGSRWAIVRRDLPTLRRNTIPTIERIRPSSFMGSLNKSTWSYRCTNGSEVLLFPETLTHDPDLDRWKGLEVNGFVLEEANELGEASFNKAIERAGTWILTEGEQPPPLIMLTCNPAKNWIKRIFYDPWKTRALAPPFFYLPARVTDNPHIPQSYLLSLEQMKQTDPRAYKRFVLGDWDQADDPTQLIRFEWIEQARSVEPVHGKKGLGVDVARYGDDDTVIAHRDGNALTRVEYHHGLSTDRVADLVMARMNDGPVDADRVNVDVVGLGAGVVDSCRRAGFNVQEVQSGGKAIQRGIDQTDGAGDSSVYRFHNLRSQLWWEYREAVRLGNTCFDVEDHRLVEDLTAPRYSVSGEKVIKVESKDEIRKRIGRSTDAGDAVVYAWADLGNTLDLFSWSVSTAGAQASPAIF